MSFSLRKEFRAGNVSKVAVKGWKSKGHYHPLVEDAPLELLLLLLMVSGAIFMLATHRAHFQYGKPGESPIEFAPMASLGLVIWILVVIYGWIWTCSVKIPVHDSNNFPTHYGELCSLASLTWAEVASLSDANLKALVRNKLAERGRALVDAERAHGVYSREQIQAKSAFEQGYKSCLSLALIEDEGYRGFIPNAK